VDPLLTLVFSSWLLLGFGQPYAPGPAATPQATNTHPQQGSSAPTSAVSFGGTLAPVAEAQLRSQSGKQSTAEADPEPAKRGQQASSKDKKDSSGDKAPAADGSKPQTSGGDAPKAQTGDQKPSAGGDPARKPEGQAAQAPAKPEEPAYPTFSVGTLTYLQYDDETQNRSGYNAFDVTRAYINVTAKLMKDVGFRVTPDIKRATDGSLNGALVLRLKYAYLQWDNPTGNGSWLRFGMHQTPWLDFEEGIDRYRVQGTMFAEREGVIPGSADLGVGYFEPLPEGYGEIQAGVYNGEGYGTPEANKYKSFQVRGTVRPLPRAGLAHGLRISGFYDLGWYSNNHPRRHGIVMASFESKHVVATAQWLHATDQSITALTRTERQGYAFFTEVRQGLEGWAGIFRFDHYDPNTAVADNFTKRTIGGIAYWFRWSRARLGLVVDDENVRYGLAAERPNENRVLAQMHVQF
jgi:hypothetical protein